jgi:pyruvate/2-oxoglutarate dehydrogenase complex dihydrolipoamide acyltransferase (E2) component
MARIPLLMPQLGESIAEATIVRLIAKPGDDVIGDTDVMEVETNKAVMGVVAPCNGKLVELRAAEGESYAVGATIGYLEVADADAERMGYLEPEEVSSNGQPTGSMPAGAPDKPKKKRVAKPEVKLSDKPEPLIKGLPVPAHAGGAAYLSPRMKARMTELGLSAADLAGVAGSGAGGRVTIEDFERFMENLDQHKVTEASSMRVAVADAMRRSWTRPLATVVLPVELDNMLAHRKASAEKAGVSLYALRALAMALSENSAPAGRLIGNQIIHPGSIDIGFAVEAAEGVLVPVIRSADKHTLRELVPIYARLVELARQRRLTPSDMGQCISTVTNYGTFGLTLATPIPLPEQTVLLGLGAGRIEPKWDKEKEQFLPVTAACFTLSFDHRVLDGGAAGRLLTRIAELLNHPEQL